MRREIPIHKHRDFAPSQIQRRLSERETQVLALVAEALANKQIAFRLGISEATVKAHISRIIQVTGCRNRVDLALHWLKRSGRLLT